MDLSFQLADIRQVGRENWSKTTTYLLLEIFQNLSALPFDETELAEQVFYTCNLLSNTRTALEVVIQQGALHRSRTVDASAFASRSTCFDHSSLIKNIGFIC